MNGIVELKIKLDRIVSEVVKKENEIVSYR